MIQGTNREFDYFAFISYKREDEKWAKWLQKKLESYSLPTAIRKENPKLPNKIRPVFRDQSELSGGNLKAEIEKGLNGSRYLIVICSPRSAKSPWVSKEVQHFIEQDRENYIIPFIIGGNPNATNPEEECFPEGLRHLTGEKEILGININELGRDAAVIKVIAHMLNLRFDTLWQRFKREKQKNRIILIAFLLTLLIISTIVAFIIYFQYRDIRETQSKFIAEKIISETEKGNKNRASIIASKLILEFPYTVEAECAIRTATRPVFQYDPIANFELDSPINSLFLHDDFLFIKASGHIRMLNVKTQEFIDSIESYYGDMHISTSTQKMIYSTNDSVFAVSYNEYGFSSPIYISTSQSSVEGAVSNISNKNNFYVIEEDSIREYNLNYGGRSLNTYTKPNNITSIKNSDDGRFVYLASYLEDWVNILDTSKPEMIHEAHFFESPFDFLVYNNNNNFLIRDISMGTLYSKMNKTHKFKNLSAVSISNNDSILAIANEYGKILLFSNDVLIKEIEASNTSITAMHVTNDCKYLVTGDKFGNIKIWTLNEPYSFSQTLKYISSPVIENLFDQMVYIFFKKSKYEFSSYNHDFIPQTSEYIFYHKGDIYIFKNLKILLKYSINCKNYRLEDISHTPDGKMICFVYDDYIYILRRNGNPTLTKIRLMNNRMVFQAKISPNGKYIALFFMGGEVQIRDIRTFKIIYVGFGYSNSPIEWAADNSLISLFNPQGISLIYNSKNHLTKEIKFQRELEHNQYSISKDANYIIARIKDEQRKIFHIKDIKSEKIVLKLSFSKQSKISNIKFSETGDSLLFFNNTWEFGTKFFSFKWGTPTQIANQIKEFNGGLKLSQEELEEFYLK